MENEPDTNAVSATEPLQNGEQQQNKSKHTVQPCTGHQLPKQVVEIMVQVPAGNSAHNHFRTPTHASASSGTSTALQLGLGGAFHHKLSTVDENEMLLDGADSGTTSWLATGAGGNKKSKTTSRGGSKHAKNAGSADLTNTNDNQSSASSDDVGDARTRSKQQVHLLETLSSASSDQSGHKMQNLFSAQLSPSDVTSTTSQQQEAYPLSLKMLEATSHSNIFSASHATSLQQSLDLQFEVNEDREGVVKLFTEWGGFTEGCIADWNHGEYETATFAIRHMKSGEILCAAGMTTKGLANEPTEVGAAAGDVDGPATMQINPNLILAKPGVRSTRVTRSQTVQQQQRRAAAALGKKGKGKQGKQFFSHKGNSTSFLPDDLHRASTDPNFVWEDDDDDDDDFYYENIPGEEEDQADQQPEQGNEAGGSINQDAAADMASASVASSKNQKNKKKKGPGASMKTVQIIEPSSKQQAAKATTGRRRKISRKTVLTLFATAKAWRRMGMAELLVWFIKRTYSGYKSSPKVRKIIIPATQPALKFWKKCGATDLQFKDTDAIARLNYRRCTLMELKTAGWESGLLREMTLPMIALRAEFSRLVNYVKFGESAEDLTTILTESSGNAISNRCPDDGQTLLFDAVQKKDPQLAFEFTRTLVEAGNLWAEVNAHVEPGELQQNKPIGVFLPKQGGTLDHEEIVAPAAAQVGRSAKSSKSSAAPSNHPHEGATTTSTKSKKMKRAPRNAGASKKTATAGALEVESAAASPPEGEGFHLSLNVLDATNTSATPFSKKSNEPDPRAAMDPGAIPAGLLGAGAKKGTTTAASTVTRSSDGEALIASPGVVFAGHNRIPVATSHIVIEHTRLDTRVRVQTSPIGKRLHDALRHQKESKEFPTLDVNAWDMNEQTALFYACNFNDRVDVIAYLLKKFANVNHVDRNRETCLFYACRRGNPRTVQVLQELGNVNYKQRNWKLLLAFDYPLQKGVSAGAAGGSRAGDGAGVQPGPAAGDHQPREGESDEANNREPVADFVGTNSSATAGAGGLQPQGSEWRDTQEACLASYFYDGQKRSSLPDSELPQFVLDNRARRNLGCDGWIKRAQQMREEERRREAERQAQVAART
ncbi:unnamed protein product, partial [Amoebophrya sp. A120]|eukprot:GSA120T00010230001.1